jgi:nucleoid-associated protein YgaU
VGGEPETPGAEPSASSEKPVDQTEASPPEAAKPVEAKPAEEAAPPPPVEEEPPPATRVEVAVVPEAEPAAPTPLQRSSRIWLWTALVLVGAAVVGGLIGTTLGGRQGGPLNAQPSGNGRPTIVVGTFVAVPSVVAAASPSAIASPGVVAAATASPAASRDYVVQPGDTLRSIAEDQYGDASLWPRIYDANRDVIGPDPDNLVAGTKLMLPAQ